MRSALSPFRFIFIFWANVHSSTYLGIGRPPGQMDPKAFVLQKFNRTGRERVSISSSNFYFFHVVLSLLILFEL